MVGRAPHRQDAASSKIEHCRAVLISYESDSRQTANRSQVSQRHRRQQPYARRRWLRVCSAPACISWSRICRHSNTRPQNQTGTIALGARNAPSKCILRAWNLISWDLISGPSNARAASTRRALSSKTHKHVQPVVMRSPSRAVTERIKQPRDSARRSWPREACRRRAG